MGGPIAVMAQKWNHNNKNRKGCAAAHLTVHYGLWALVAESRTLKLLNVQRQVGGGEVNFNEIVIAGGFF